MKNRFLALAALSSLCASASEIPQKLSQSDWSSIRSEYDRHRQAAVPIEEGGYRARNYSQHWTTRFDGRSFVIEPEIGGWNWGLALKSYGFPGEERAVQQAQAAADVEKFAYQWDSTIKEWFVNGNDGLEHGFTLAARPANSPGSPLALHLIVLGTLTPVLSKDGQSVSFVDTSGAAKVNYSGLKVRDAAGHTLNARFRREQDGLRLEVEESAAVYPLTIDPTAVEQAYLIASNKRPGDEFGASVAVNGDTAIIGAPGESSDATGVDGDQTDTSDPGAGAAYVFVRTGVSWSQQAYLKAPDTAAGANFGAAVAISGDTVAIGAPNSGPSGEVSVYVRDRTTWSFQQSITPTASTNQIGFGASLALDGNTLVVGAPNEASDATGVNGNANDASAPNAGAAYAYARTGNIWSQQAYLKSSNTAAQGFFGSSIAISGATVLVGAWGESAAHIFVSDGTTWSDQADLTPAVASYLTVGGFGKAVALDGDTAAVGSVSTFEPPISPQPGEAYVFVRSGIAWTQQAQLFPESGCVDQLFVSVSSTSCTFGAALAVSGDLVLASEEILSQNYLNNTSSDSRQTLVFQRSGTAWNQTGPALPGSNSVAVDQNTTILGAPALGEGYIYAIDQTLQSDQIALYFPTDGSQLTATFQSAEPITGFTASISGPAAADFSQWSSCISNTCWVVVTFVSTTPGVRSATLSVTSASNPSEIDVPLQGFGFSLVNLIGASQENGLTPSAVVGSTQYTSIAFSLPPPVTFSGVQITGAYAADYTVNPPGLIPTCATDGYFGTILYCNVSITFAPSAAGPRPANAVVNTSVGSLALALNGIGLTASTTLSLSPSSLSFNNQGVNTQSAFQEVKVEAGGTLPVTLGGVSLTGPNAGDFVFNNGCAASSVAITIYPGNPPCALTVAFTPKATGPRTATLMITDNASGAPHSVALGGTGVNSAASFLFGQPNQFVGGQSLQQVITPSTDFGQTVVGSSSSQTNWVVNTGSTYLNVSEALAGPNAGDFVLNPNGNQTECTIASGLGPNGACQSTIAFVPTGDGVRSAVLTVTDVNSGESQSFPLTGAGVDGTKLIAFVSGTGPENSLSFGSATVGSKILNTVEIQNVGTGSVTILSPAFYGNNASDFSIANHNCPVSPQALTPGQTCNVQLQFAPSGEGYRAATLAIYSDAGRQTLTLTGAAEPAQFSPALSVEAVDFGVVPVGTSINSTSAYAGSLRFTNYGAGLVTIGNASISGPNAQDFALIDFSEYLPGFPYTTQAPCSVPMSPSETCSWTVRFTPSVPGPEVAYLSFNLTSPAGTYVVALYGVGSSGGNTGVVAVPAVLDIPQGSDSTDMVQIISPTGQPFQVSSTSLSGPDANQFTLKPQVCLLQYCISVNAPSTTAYLGTASATLTVVTDSGTLNVPIIANRGISSAAIRYQTAVNLSAAVGQTTEFDEYIYQTGTPQLSYSVAPNAVTGANASDFAVGHQSCFFGNSFCILPILFTPSQHGPESATLTLTGTGSAVNPLPPIQLSGSGQ